MGTGTNKYWAYSALEGCYPLPLSCVWFLDSKPKSNENLQELLPPFATQVLRAVDGSSGNIQVILRNCMH
eukprot:607447-Amorphochlora_amoeboformis.AAC.1